MTDPLATLPDLLARLEGAEEPMRIALPRWRDEWKRERAECATAIRALMVEREQIAALLDRHKIAVPGGSRQWMLMHRVEIACMAATDQSDGAQHSARIAEIEWERDAAIRALMAERDAAVTAEREACAKVCDGAAERWARSAHPADPDRASAAESLAAVIRARGES